MLVGVILLWVETKFIRIYNFSTPDSDHFHRTKWVHVDIIPYIVPHLKKRDADCDLCLLSTLPIAPSDSSQLNNIVN